MDKNEGKNDNLIIKVGDIYTLSPIINRTTRQKINKKI